MRLRVCVPLPQLPQVALSVSVEPAAQPPPPEHVPHAPQSPHSHDVEQMRMRVCVPSEQWPHVCMASSELPGMQPLSPVHAPQALQVPQAQSAWHVRVRVWTPLPQLPHGCESVSTSSGVQPSSAWHSPHAPQSFQVQDSLQVRVRSRIWPQMPQPPDSVCTPSGAHSPSPVQVHASHVHVALQVRTPVPQLPQAAPVSTRPGEHSPLPVHAPSFTHAPPVQRWSCVPQFPHATSRVVPSSSTLHSHDGASHAPQRPIVHVWTPFSAAQPGAAQGRVPLMPSVGSPSSQSTVAGTPSPSSSAGGTHRPSTQVSPGSQSHCGSPPSGFGVEPSKPAS